MRFSLINKSTGSDAIRRIGDAFVRILSQRESDVIEWIGDAQTHIGVALTTK
jgi:hypothetical protein